MVTATKKEVRKQKVGDVCPRCEEAALLGPTLARNALSRRDNSTYICSGCGTQETMFDFAVSAALEKKGVRPFSLRVGRLMEADWVRAFHGGEFPRSFINHLNR